MSEQGVAESPLLESELGQREDLRGPLDTEVSILNGEGALVEDSHAVGRSMEADAILADAGSDARSSTVSTLGKSLGKNENSAVRTFSNYEDANDPNYNNGRRHDIYKYRWLYILSYFSILSGPAVFWRFPSLFLNIVRGPDIQWEHLSVWTVLIPFSVLLILLGWPVLILESGTSTLARGGAMQVFGSIGTRLRPVGLNFMVALATATFIPLFVADSFSYMVHAFDGTYPAQVSGMDNEQMFHCLIDNDYGNNWPDFVSEQQSRLRRLDSYENQTPNLRSGKLNLEKLAKINSTLSSVGERQVGVDFPWRAEAASMGLYCSTSAAYYVDYNQYYFAFDLATENADWDDSGVWWNYRKIIAICVLWMLACLFTLLGHTKMQWVRPFIWLYGFVMLIACLGLGGVTYSCFQTKGPGSDEWKQLFTSIDRVALKSPATWAFVTSQVLLSLNIGQGIIPEYTYHSGKFTQNLVKDNSWFLLLATLTNLGWGFVAVLGTLIGVVLPRLANDVSLRALLDQIVVNAPGQEIFVAINNILVTFDIVQKDNDFNPTYLWAFFIFLGFFLIGVNCMAAALQAMVMGLAGNLTRENPARRGAFTFAFGLLCLGMNVILSWSIGYPFAMGLCQYAVTLFLPLATYIELTSMTWFLNWHWFCYHMGKGAAWTQFLMVHGGFWIAGLGMGFTFVDFITDTDKTLYIVFVCVGFAVAVLGIIFPPLCAHKVDPDDTKQSSWFRFKYMFWGRMEMLRSQINVTCCHTTKFWRLTPLWCILVRYCAPCLCVISFCIPICSAMSTVNFSAYFPFKLQGYYPDSRLPTLYLGLSAVIPLLAVLFWIIFTVVPDVLLFCRCTPKGAMPIHFLPMDAAVGFASKQDNGAGTH